MASTNNIIDNIIKTPRSRELMRIIIPILIKWAKAGKTDATYEQLIHGLGMKQFSGLGKQLEFVQRVINELHTRTGVDIPTLNSLAKSKANRLPSEGFSFISEKYKELNDKEKKIFVAGVDSKAINFQHWDWVMNQLELSPAKKIIKEEEIQSLSQKMIRHGGEGEEHKKIKQFILEHPETLGFKDVVFSSDEFFLPSGDRLDVYFVRNNDNRIAVEVKSSKSPNEDILRGIFQCVKYKAVLEAVRTIICEKFDVSTLLVIGGSMSSQNKDIAMELGVNFIENFNFQ